MPFIILLMIGGTLTSDAFLSFRNLVNVLSQSSILMVVVAAELLVLLAGEIDLSVESVVSLAPMAAAILMAPVSTGGIGWEISGYLGIVVALMVGAFTGAINGLLIVGVKLNAFITTLAMLILLRGVALGVGKGNTVYDLPHAFLFVGLGRVGGIPMPIIVAGVVVIVMGLFLRFHWVGRSIYAIGGNADAARTAGIKVDRTRFLLFIAAGTLAALGGIMLTGRIASANSEQGANLIFSALAAAVIGGVSLNGGRGSVVGALLGVLLLGLVDNVLLLAQVATYWIDATYGAIIVIALLLSRFVGGVSRK
jgi:ribose/xylose/arabinose/galactoside ABC-type transport system permease subunit